ncbi:hypothetical protein [Tomitella gaofuii]|uniref:hypothetical protein n=1 Tax=Tomitella gaofuii TaxID=2760083 RepID=UPI0015FC2675|nr:hypothetical protein [Tomitella gaofuii]
MRIPGKLALTGAAVLTLGVAAAPAATALPSTDSLGPPPAGCAVDADRVAQDTPPPEGMPTFEGWVVTDLAAPCGNLGYIVLDTKGGTGSSPSAVLLYHRGTPTATQPEPGLPAEVTGSSGFHVVLQQWTAPPPGVPNADAPSRSTLFVWNPFAGDVAPIPLP